MSKWHYSRCHARAETCTALNDGAVIGMRLGGAELASCLPVAELLAAAASPQMCGAWDLPFGFHSTRSLLTMHAVPLVVSYACCFFELAELAMHGGCAN